MDLSLGDYNVLTEMGAGLYSLMPIIPLMAWTQDSINGSAEGAILQCRMILASIGNSEIDFYLSALVNHLKQVDMITNSAF